ncbi:MAG: hypothetical protein AB1644_04170 [Candidatus Zixiibacteriota bacterium]
MRMMQWRNGDAFNCDLANRAVAKGSRTGYLHGSMQSPNLQLRKEPI